MGWTSGFFNSDNGDRLYNSEQLSSMFKGLITAGVYESVGNKLAVQPNSGMTIQINTGRGWFYDKWVENDSPYLITLNESDVTLDRYAMIGVRVDVNNSARTAEPLVKYSEFSSDPVKPTPERSEKVHEYVLAYVYIKARANEITASVIEDTRGNTELCGWVTGLIKQIDTTTLFAQYDAIFKEWMASLTDYLEGDVEAKLIYDVTQLKGREFKVKSLLDAGEWKKENDGTYSQTIIVNGVTTESDLMIAPENEDSYYKANCRPVEQGLHSVTFKCDTPPSADIAVTIIVFNVNTMADVVIESVADFTVTDDGNGNVTINN